jgi:hypothetical protein
VRSDPADRAGGSAADGFAAAWRAARRRRLVQFGALSGGLAVAAGAPGLAWRGAGLLVAAVVAVAARPDRDPGRWLRGAAGEEATAALLEGLPRRRWVLYHDRSVPGSAANLDHVAIGPTGVWMIDTKTFRAPLRAGWRSVRAGDHPVDTGPAAWEAAIVADRLDTEVTAVLAVHGEGLPRRGRRVGGVAVLPAAAVPDRLRRRRGSARLSRREVSTLAEAFDRAFPPAVARHRPTAAGAGVRAGGGVGGGRTARARSPFATAAPRSGGRRRQPGAGA